MKHVARGVKVVAALAIAAMLALGWLDSKTAGATETGDGALPLEAASPEPAGTTMRDLAHWKPSYVPGRGMRFGETGLVIGGYGSIDLVRDEGAPARLTLEDLSFFVMVHAFERFSFFSELEFEDLFTVDTDGNAGSPDDRFEIERLYGDFAINDRLNLRAGKFLTPVGRWNVIHAQPLVWTTSRPLLTDVPFDENTTGLMLSGSLADGWLDYDLFGQFTNQLEPTPQVMQADRSGGARLTLEPIPGLSLGGTYLASRSEGEWFHLIGLDALWRTGPFEWMSEATFDEGAGSSGSQWGIYSQVAAELISKVYAVGRYEHFAPRGGYRHLNQVVIGAAYRPRPYAIFKIEYQILDHTSDLTEAGFRSSFALLF